MCAREKLRCAWASAGARWPGRPLWNLRSTRTSRRASLVLLSSPAAIFRVGSSLRPPDSPPLASAGPVAALTASPPPGGVLRVRHHRDQPIQRHHCTSWKQQVRCCPCPRAKPQWALPLNVSSRCPDLGLLSTTPPPPWGLGYGSAGVGLGVECYPQNLEDSGDGGPLGSCHILSLCGREVTSSFALSPGGLRVHAGLRSWAVFNCSGPWLQLLTKGHGLVSPAWCPITAQHGVEASSSWIIGPTTLMTLL